MGPKSWSRDSQELVSGIPKLWSRGIPKVGLGTLPSIGLEAPRVDHRDRQELVSRPQYFVSRATKKWSQEPPGVGLAALENITIHTHARNSFLTNYSVCKFFTFNN